MKTGIIGLPQVGKTSLFRILTKAHLAPTNPREAHIGVAKVPDHRLDRLAAQCNPKKLTHAAVEYVDLGAIGQDALKESGYIGHLRNVDAIAHVVRAFEDNSIPHSGPIDPLRDIKNVEFDLLVSDLGQIEKRLERVEKDLKKMRSADLEKEFELLKRGEAQLAEMSDADAAEFLSSYGLTESGLARLIRKTYALLGLISFFTAGEDECRAWTIPVNTRAVQGAGAIHSDLEHYFIRAETIRWDQLLEAGSEANARAKGTLRLEGKDYIVQDGDVMHIRHSG